MHEGANAGAEARAIREAEDRTTPPRPDAEAEERFFGSPALQEGGVIGRAPAVDEGRAMSVRGTAMRALILFEVALVAGWVSWSVYATGANVVPLLWGGLVVGAVLALVIIGKPMAARWLSVPYAACEGLALGGLSASLDELAPGLVRTAIVGTVLVSAAVLLISLLLPKALTRGFTTGVVIATAAIAGVYVIDLIASALGAPVIFLHESGWLAVVASIVVIVVACGNLLLDIAFIRTQAERGAPADLQWYAAWSLLVTVVWIYVEIARILLAVGGDGDGD